jgi:hypothetical protein
MKFALFVSAIFLLYILLVLSASRSVEGFGVFGCTPVPFDKFLKDMYTPQELANYLKNTWDPKTANEKNKEIAAWDSNSCENQNSTYNMLVAARQKRDTVDALATSQ